MAEGRQVIDIGISFSVDYHRNKRVTTAHGFGECFRTVTRRHYKECVDYKARAYVKLREASRKTFRESPFGLERLDRMILDFGMPRQESVVAPMHIGGV